MKARSRPVRPDPVVGARGHRRSRRTGGNRTASESGGVPGVSCANACACMCTFRVMGPFGPRACRTVDGCAEAAGQKPRQGRGDVGQSCPRARAFRMSIDGNTRDRSGRASQHDRRTGQLDIGRTRLRCGARRSGPLGPAPSAEGAARGRFVPCREYRQPFARSACTIRSASTGHPALDPSYRPSDLDGQHRAYREGFRV